MWKKSNWCILVAWLGCFLALAWPAYGSGFALYEAGARSSALAGTVNLISSKKEMTSQCYL